MTEGVKVAQNGTPNSERPGPTTGHNNPKGATRKCSLCLNPKPFSSCLVGGEQQQRAQQQDTQRRDTLLHTALCATFVEHSLIVRVAVCAE